MSNGSSARNPSTSTVARLAVLRIDPGQKVHVRSLSDGYGGLLTHFRGRSIYCEGEQECRLCRTHPDTCWKGYFAGEAWDPRRTWWLPVVMEMTESCELDLRYRFKRGQVWLFSRAPQTGKKKTPVSASLIEELDPESLPASFEVYAVLRTLYHVRNISLATPNPLPDRVMIEPTAGPAPASFTAKDASPVDPRTFKELLEKARTQATNGTTVPSNGHANQG